jgi:tetratricopeptide (TPR) repeat protein
MASDKTNLSSKLKKIYEKYFIDGGGDPAYGLALVDKLLEEYPYYTEALLYKARMLMANENYDEAEKCIQKLKSIDHWNKSYIYDEAELIYRNNNKAGIDYIHDQIGEVIDNAVSGLSNFLLSIKHAEREKVKDDLLLAVLSRIKDKWKLLD